MQIIDGVPDKFRQTSLAGAAQPAAWHHGYKPNL